MARPPKPDSGYRVSVHAANGYRYASTQQSFVDKDTGKKKYRHVHWGCLDDSNRFIPGRAYFLADPEERAKLIFPKDWDISATRQFSGVKVPGRHAYSDDDVNRLYGDVWLLEQVADKVGIRRDLMAVFNENAELVDDIITLAIFPIVTEFSYRRLPRWQRIVKTPSGHDLTPSFITKLTQRITESDRMELFRLRAKRLGKEELLAVDSTTRSAYGDSLADVHWGKNKDGVDLPVTKEVVAYTLTSHMPVYYRTFSGNMPDSRSMETILTDLCHAGFENIIIVTDRGYESLRNLETYILKGQPFIVCSNTDRGIVLDKIKSFGAFNVRPEGMDVDPDLQIYYTQFDSEYEVKAKNGRVRKAVLKVNLYLDPVRRSAEQVNIDAQIKLQEAELKKRIAEGTPCEEDSTMKRIFRFFKVTYDPTSRLIQGYERDEKKIEKACLTSGFFAITSFKVQLDAMATYHHYRLRDEQEKYFQQMKGQLNFDKQQNWSEEGKTGRLFILFVSLILTSYVRYIWKTTMLHDIFESSLDILDEMRSIRCIEHTHKSKFITPFVGAQVDICEAFDIEIPEGCKPTYTSKRAYSRRRGRPRKPLTEREQ